MSTPGTPTPASQLKDLLIPTDHLGIDSDGDLQIENQSAPELLGRFGSPLYVISEATLRANFRRIRRAFESSWPSPVNIMYAIKANTNLAVRAILHQEGAGGDCFSEGELLATFKAGADPDKIALNGGCKSPACLRIAVERGITVNLDAESEIDPLLAICRELGKTVKLNIRLKAVSDDFNETRTDYFGGPRLADHVRRVKWGFSPESCCKLIPQIQAKAELCLTGFSAHIGRVSSEENFYRAYGHAIAEAVLSIHKSSGFAPSVLDIGGGWPRERDPESRHLALNPVPVETYASLVCTAIAERFDSRALPFPELWVEPGRYIVGNASVLLATVQTIKHDLGLTWVHVDAGTNELPRIDTSGSAYHVIAATEMNRPAKQSVDIVGPTCIDSLLGRDVAMPELRAGNIIAVLDAGMYSESASTQFNSIPRPATVLVNGADSDVVKSRETLDDVFRHQRIPERFKIQTDPLDQ